MGKVKLTAMERTWQTAVFALLGALLLVGDKCFDMIPNVHPLGMLMMAYTLTYRGRAIIPIMIYVFLIGYVDGFSPMWWPMYLYTWPVLWLMTLALPRRMPLPVAVVVYAAVCGAFGFLFGLLCLPYTAIVVYTPDSWQDFCEKLSLLFAADIPFDVLHAVGNAAAGLLTVPMTALLCRLEHRRMPFYIKKDGEAERAIKEQRDI